MTKFDTQPEPEIEQTTARELRQRRRMATVVMATVGLLGILLFVAGITEAIDLGSGADWHESRANHQTDTLARWPDRAAGVGGHHWRQNWSAGQTSTTDPSPQAPNTIQLPRGGTASVVPGHVAADGSLPVPSGVTQAVWWGTGLSAPAGATVFAGHVNWAGATGPFAELWHDNVGDVISVRDNAGTERRFRVTQVLTLTKAQLPQQASTLFAATGAPRIVLVTCGGEWVGGPLGYADNRVLVASHIG